MATQHGPLLMFRTGGSRLALPLAEVARVLPVPLLLPPVGAPHFVEGFFDFQGRPVAAVRLDRLLELDEERLGLYAPLLLLAHEDRTIALHVAGVDGIRKVLPSDIQPIAGDETFNACVAGRITDRQETVYVLARRQVLLAVERQALAAHELMNERRINALGDITHAA